MQNQRTIVVVPCYNEANRLKTDRFLEFMNEQKHCELLFVNDGSTDNTWLTLQFLASNSERISAVNLPVNVGKAEAVRHGLLLALERSPTYVAYWDADLATPIEAVQRFERSLAELPDIFMVLGCRIRLRGHAVRRRIPRRIAGQCFAAAASGVLGMRVRDTQCGAKMFRCCAELGRAFAKPFRSRWIFDVELISRLQVVLGQRSKDAFLELPLFQWTEIEGSKIKISDWLVAAGDLIRIGTSRPDVGDSEIKKMHLLPPIVSNVHQKKAA